MARRVSKPSISAAEIAAIRKASEEAPPLTAKQKKELDRIIAEHDDPTRYLVVSAFSKKFVLYYNVEDNCYAHNRPEGGTAFKSHDIAEAVLKALSSSRKKRTDTSLQLIRVRKSKNGLRLIERPVSWLSSLKTRSVRSGNLQSGIRNPKS